MTKLHIHAHQTRNCISYNEGGTGLNFTIIPYDYFYICYWTKYFAPRFWIRRKPFGIGLDAKP